ncbi:MAG: hypothetical protein PUD09_05455 [Coriobacteriales bacterium]|nr:hypothetical protein [Coriobacteriales bacterium]
MSLRDTIRGAREEAAANANDLRKGSDDTKPADDDVPKEREGFSKKSITRARPAREAAQGVRVVDARGNSSHGKTPQSKEERKEAKRRVRELDDMRATVSNIMLEQNPDYIHRRRVWWGLMGAGFACLVVELIVYGVGTQGGQAIGEVAGIISVLLMVLAYAAIIGSLVYDWVKVRPLRKVCDSVADGMTVKKMNSVIDNDARERAARKAQKEAAKAAKKK